VSTRTGSERLEIAKPPVVFRKASRMNTHKHARLTFARRLEMVRQMTFEGLNFAGAAAEHGVTPATARKWLGRFLAGGESALVDASSRPARSPRSIDPGKALLIVELRRRHMLQVQIARSVGVSESTVNRVLARAGLSKLSDLRPVESVQRYEHEAPGDLLHIDTKKLGRIVRPSHRVTGNRRDGVDGAGWEMLFVAIDDHARIAFTAMHPDEKAPQAVQFLKDAVAYYARLGVSIKRLLTTTDRRSAHTTSREHAKPWASSIGSRAPTGRRQTARPSGSSSRPCESGPTAGRTRTRRIERRPWPAGSITTTGTVRTAASVALHPCPDSALQETTS
jgi:transposase-like protein